MFSPSSCSPDENPICYLHEDGTATNNIRGGGYHSARTTTICILSSQHTWFKSGHFKLWLACKVLNVFFAFNCTDDQRKQMLLLPEAVGSILRPFVLNMTLSCSPMQFSSLEL